MHQTQHAQRPLCPALTAFCPLQRLRDLRQSMRVTPRAFDHMRPPSFGYASPSIVRDAIRVQEGSGG